MAKAMIKENHSKSVEGTLNLTEGEELTIEIPEIGVKKLSELFKNFNGCHIVISAKLALEPEE